MPENTLNFQGLPCPEPVIRLKKHLEEHSPTHVTAIVDNEPCRENVTRFLSNAGYVVHTEHNTEKNLWTVHAKRIQGEVPRGDMDIPPIPHSDSSTNWLPREMTKAAFAPEKRHIAVLLTSPFIGTGDDGLGEKLMTNFLSTLPEMGDDLWRVILLNGAVRLACTGSPVLEKLRSLENTGAHILVCGTCLEHFGLTSLKAVGETTNMLDVVTSLQLADSVIRP